MGRRPAFPAVFPTCQFLTVLVPGDVLQAAPQYFGALLPKQCRVPKLPRSSVAVRSSWIKMHTFRQTQSSNPSWQQSSSQGIEQRGWSVLQQRKEELLCWNAKSSPVKTSCNCPPSAEQWLTAVSPVLHQGPCPTVCQTGCRMESGSA